MSASEPETPEPAHKAKVTAHMTYLITVAGNVAAAGAKSKAKAKQKKETKAKEFSHNFEASQENYLALLKMILLKHREEKYNVTNKMTYGIKVQLPGVNKGNSLDIDTLTEYEDLVHDIIQGMPSKLNIFIDMVDIQTRWSGRGSGSDNEDGEDAGLYDANGLSDLERELARLRGKLEKQWQNDHDAGYTYIDSRTGESYPLTPQLMKEWCRAVYDGQATITEPPKFITSFDPVNRQVALHPGRIAAGANKPRGSIAASSDVAEVVGALATMVTALVGGGARPAQLPGSPAMPSTPQNKASVSSPSASQTSPIVPSPTKLPRYLDYAEKTLGVTAARTYEPMLRQNGYGPDIMHLVEDRELVDLGMTKGDVLRLKAGSQAWWNGPNAKRKRSDVEGADKMPGSAGRITPPVPYSDDLLMTPPAKKVAFERRWEDGGRERFYGPRIVAGGRERDVWYRCPVRGKFVPVPLGYRSTQECELPGSDDDETELDLMNPMGVSGEEEVDAAAVLAGFRSGNV